MKSIILIRHANSNREFEIKDFDRELIEKGIKNSIKCANVTLNEIDFCSIIYTSPAKRAIHTAEIFLKIWKLNIKSIKIVPELYTFDVNELEQIVKSCPNNKESLILFGHNSAITDFVNKFGDIFIENVPTSGLVSITFDTDNWNNIIKGKTNRVLFPRDI